MKRPLLKVALLYASGILLGEQVSVPLALLFGLTWGVGLLAVLLHRQRPYLLMPVLVLLGMLNVTRHRAIVSPNDLRRLATPQPEVVTVRGTLDRSPIVRVNPQARGETSRTMARLRVSSLKQDGAGWQRACGRVLVGMSGVLPEPVWDGQAVAITGVLSQPEGPGAEGLFDYRKYLRNAEIYYQLRVQSAADWQVLGPRKPAGLPERFRSWAQRTLGRGLPEHDPAVELLWAMTLGWKTGLTGEMSEPFMQSGTLHVFAISGLHVALLCGILLLILRVLRVPRALRGVVVIPALWFYAAVTGWPASAVRASVMMSVIVAGGSLGRPSDLLNSLAAAAFLILLWDPLQLFQASFQLSFSVVLSLALVGPWLRRGSQQWWQPDPWLPQELRSPWQRRFQTAWHWLRTNLVVSLAAWLGSVPLIAQYFHLFTPVSLLANVVIVNLALVTLTSSLASLTCGAWLPAASELFNHSAWFFMNLMTRASQTAADLPGAWLYVRSPGWAGFLLYYGLLISVTAGWFRRPKLRRWLATALGLLACVWAGQKIVAAGKTRLTVLPLRGGQAIHFDAPGRRHDLLIDCGDEASAKAVVIPFLQAHGVNRLPGLVLTHGDVRHVGGAGTVADHFPARRVWISPHPFRSPYYKRSRARFAAIPDCLREVKADDEFGPWQVLHPAASDHFAKADNGALVLWANFGSARVLLLSDLGKPGQAALVARYPKLRADIAVSGMPTGSEPLANLFLDRLQPQLLIVVDALRPATARASRELQARLNARGIPVLYTRETGAVTISLGREKWQVTAMNGATYSGQRLDSRPTPQSPAPASP